MTSSVQDLPQIFHFRELSTTSSALMEQLTIPPKISLQILGVHTTSELDEAIDFDLWIDCARGSEIKSGELVTSGSGSSYSWNRSTDSGSFQDVLNNWLSNYLQSDHNSNCLTLHKLVSLSDHDRTAITAYIERLARNTTYNGSVRVIFHAPTTQLDLLHEISPQSVEIWLQWNFDCSFPATNPNWDSLVMNAIVDRKRGWIASPDRKSPYGMSPFRRAIKSRGNSQILSQGRDPNKVTYSVRQFSQWGGDEVNS